MVSKTGQKKLRSLASGRPPTVIKHTSLSSKITRTVIRKHHNLQKQKAKALKEGDSTTVQSIEAEIQANGGLETYQRASLLGQQRDRGGDSSKILMEWLQPHFSELKSMSQISPLRMLEVGALSTTNACARSGIFRIERIDLNSQGEGILRQDFMQRPIPEVSTDKFHIVSLSLVLNYVPDPVGRGHMLRRTLEFLENPPVLERDGAKTLFPCLFLVLPASCVTNSRYLDGPRLQEIMDGLGYDMVRQKLSPKLAYYLWRGKVAKKSSHHNTFKKVEVRSGSTRNNFAVVLD